MYVPMKDRPVIDFSLRSEFTWDMLLHFPVLKASFVDGKLGTDLIAFSGSDIQADKLLNQIAKIAKDYLLARIPMKSRTYQLFRIAHDEDALNEILEYQLAFVIAATTSGNIYDLYNITKGLENKPYIAGLENAVAQVSAKFRAWEDIPQELINNGY